jgi:hypothetical protein
LVLKRRNTSLKGDLFETRREKMAAGDRCSVRRIRSRTRAGDAARAAGVKRSSRVARLTGEARTKEKATAAVSSLKTTYATHLLAALLCLTIESLTLSGAPGSHLSNSHALLAATTTLIPTALTILINHTTILALSTLAGYIATRTKIENAATLIRSN